MVNFRTFLNSDPPELARLWTQQPSAPHVLQPLTASLLEVFVFSKPYFDPAGLIVAEEDDRLTGFVHVGFGPNSERSGVCKQLGVICMVLVADRPDRDTIADALIERGEHYLISHGVEQLRGGAVFPFSPFYLGLYGGSEMPGVVLQDQPIHDLYRRHGYQQLDRTIQLARSLSGFRPPLDSRHLDLRRDYRITAEVNPHGLAWWDVCAYGPSDRIRYQLASRSHPDKPVAGVDFWDMGPLAHSDGQAAMGLLDWSVAQDISEAGLDAFLLGEALRHLGESGVSHVRTQILGTNEPRRALFERLGFQPQGEGLVYGKPVV